MHKLATLALAVAVMACGGKKDDKKAVDDKATATTTESAKPDEAAKPAPPPPPEAKGRKIPNGSGLVVDAPAKWLDNGIGGAAGMHLDNDQGGFSLNEVSPEEAAKSLEQHKKDTEEYLFEKWVSSDKTADGWKLVYVLDKVEIKNDEAKKVGTTFAFDVRRKIGDKLYSCSGSGATKEIADEAVALCTKIEGS
jgi:hypothetical protein